MSDDAHLPPAPAAAVSSPRIPWGRMALIHFSAAFLVAFLVPVFLFEFAPEAYGLGAISGLVITAAAGSPAYLGAYLASRVVRARRTRRRDVTAVIVGALVGALITMLVFAVVFGFASDTPWWLGVVVGLASAGGFALQVQLAWGRSPDPLN